MTPDSSRNRRHCLLFPQSLSIVPLYADESDCKKSNFLFRHLPACRYFIDTLKTARKGQSFHLKINIKKRLLPTLVKIF